MPDKRVHGRVQRRRPRGAARGAPALRAPAAAGNAGRHGSDRRARALSPRPAPRHRRHRQERGPLHPRMGRLPPRARRRPLLRRRQRRDRRRGARSSPRSTAAGSSATSPSRTGPGAGRSCPAYARSCAGTAPRPTGSPSSTPTSSCCPPPALGARCRAAPRRGSTPARGRRGRGQLGGLRLPGGGRRPGRAGDRALRPPGTEQGPLAPPPLQDRSCDRAPRRGRREPARLPAARRLPRRACRRPPGAPASTAGISGLSATVVWAPLRLNHYVVKSREEFIPASCRAAGPPPRGGATRASSRRTTATRSPTRPPGCDAPGASVAAARRGARAGLGPPARPARCRRREPEPAAIALTGRGLRLSSRSAQLACRRSR